MEQVYQNVEPLATGKHVTFDGDIPLGNFRYLVEQYSAVVIKNNSLISTVTITTQQENCGIRFASCSNLRSIDSFGGIDLYVFDCNQLQTIVSTLRADKNYYVDASSCAALRSITSSGKVSVRGCPLLVSTPRAMTSTISKRSDAAAAAAAAPAVYGGALSNVAKAAPVAVQPLAIQSGTLSDAAKIVPTSQSRVVDPARMVYDPSFQVMRTPWSKFHKGGGGSMLVPVCPDHLKLYGDISPGVWTLEQLRTGDNLAHYIMLSFEGNIPIGSIAPYVRLHRDVYILDNDLLAEVNETIPDGTKLFIGNCYNLRSLTVRGSGVELIVQQCDHLELIDADGSVEVRDGANLRAIRNADTVMVAKCPLLRELPRLPGPGQKITIHYGCPLVPQPVGVLPHQITFWPQGAGYRTKFSDDGLSRMYIRYKEDLPIKTGVEVLDLSYVYSNENVFRNMPLLVIGSQEDWTRRWRLRRLHETLAEITLAIKAAVRSRQIRIPPEMWMHIHEFLRPRM
jgi:hypothetical protein